MRVAGGNILRNLPKKNSTDKEKENVEFGIKEIYEPEELKEFCRPVGKLRISTPGSDIARGAGVTVEENCRLLVAELLGTVCCSDNYHAQQLGPTSFKLHNLPSSTSKLYSYFELTFYSKFQL